MEASYSGMDTGINKGMHLHVGMLEDIGKHVCETLLGNCVIYSLLI
jgi:hypothetical protein